MELHIHLHNLSVQAARALAEGLIPIGEKIVASHQDVLQALQTVQNRLDTGFADLTSTLQAEVQQVKDAIAAAQQGGDLQDVLDAVNALDSNMQQKFQSFSTDVSNVIP